MSKKNNGFTRQGVRDLNHIKSVSVGVRMELPPEEEVGPCKHKRTKMSYGDKECLDCGIIFDNQPRWI